jgi:hypothetical protein
LVAGSVAVTDAQLYVALAAYIALSLTIGVISARRFAKTNPEPIYVYDWDLSYWKTTQSQIMNRGLVAMFFWPFIAAWRALTFCFDCIGCAFKLIFVPRGMR